FYHGYKVGKIRSIAWKKEGKLKVGVRILEDVDIPLESEFVVEDSSFFGGKQLRILDPVRPSGASIRGGDELVGRGESRPLLETMKEAVQNVQEIVEIGREDLIAALSSLRRALDAIAEGEGTLGQLIQNPSVYETLQDAMENLKEIAEELNDPRFIEQVKQAAETMNRILQSLDEANLGRTVKEIGDSAATAGELLDRVQKGPGSIHRLIYREDLVRNLEELTGRLSRGEGTIGRLFKDDTLYLKLEEILEPLPGIEKKVDQIAERLLSTESTVGKLLDSAELYDNANEAMEALKNTLGVASRTSVSVGIAYRHTFEQELGIAKMFLRLIPRGNRYFLVGGSLMNPSSGGPIIFDEDDQDEGKAIVKVDVQIAQILFFGREDLNPWNDVAVGMRVGLIEGKPGGGLDIDFLQAFRFTVEARDSHKDQDKFDEKIDRFMLRSELSVRIWKYFRVYAGVDNIVEDAGFLAGIQVEWFDEDIKGLVSLLATAF
ncbi:MAG: hypothetical protein O6952_05085, partial [Planctomycetota bacterium]|nr:hypothetical protein [Planctomycetota bacterium]